MINLLPKTEKENLKKGLKLRFWVITLFFITAAFGLGILVLLPSHFLVLSNLAQTELADESVAIKNGGEMEDILNLPEKINLRSAFFQTNNANLSAIDVLVKITEVIPAGIALDSVSFSRNQPYGEKNGILVLVSGIAGSRESLTSFSALLRKTNYFSLVDVPVSSLTKDKNLPFSINIFIEN